MARYETDLNNKEFTVSKRIVYGACLHFHSFYEIEFFTDGCTSHLLNGVESEAKKGYLVFMSPRDFHSIGYAEKPVNIFNISFCSHMLSSGMINLINESKPPFAIQLEGEDFGKMLFSFEELLSESETEDSFHERSLKYKISSVCIDIIRRALEDRKKIKAADFPVKDSESFRAIVDEIIPYLNDNYMKRITRNEAARMVHLTPAYFSETFKKHLGVSFSDYMIDIRMSQAMRMLKYSDETIAEIMSAIGYNSSSAFYEQFKKTFGVLPGDIKRMSKNE